MTQIPALLVTEFSREETDLLWAQNVDMDDWDICVLLPAEMIREVREMREVNDWVNGAYTTKMAEVHEWVCDDHPIDRLLERHSVSHRWYMVEWKGEKKALGVAYH